MNNVIIDIEAIAAKRSDDLTPSERVYVSEYNDLVVKHEDFLGRTITLVGHGGFDNDRVDVLRGFYSKAEVYNGATYDAPLIASVDPYGEIGQGKWRYVNGAGRRTGDGFASLEDAVCSAVLHSL